MADELKPMPHVGQLLKTFTEEKRTRKSAWARRQGVYPHTVTGYFKKPGMKLQTLFAISQVLKHNFIREIADALPAEFPARTTSAMQQRIGDLEKENERLRIENEVLKGLVGGK